MCWLPFPGAGKPRYTMTFSLLAAASSGRQVGRYASRFDANAASTVPGKKRFLSAETTLHRRKLASQRHKHLVLIDKPGRAPVPPC